ncbi:tRNA (adenosine(37)-N6)-dimethylallyltransferase MiaA, partial [Mycolicibacterium elephantis]
MTRPIAVVGPTGTGKSELALTLAERVGGEIVNADAMQLYRGMDIGTAKLSVAQRRGIPHHQLDVLEVSETASVARYQQAAAADVEAIAARGAVPIVVGGSMMYVQSLLDDWTFPATDPAVRAKWEQRLAEVGVGALHAELERVDPAAAASILSTDGRRIVRALEVIELTGQPFAASFPEIGAPRWDTAIIG